MGPIDLSGWTQDKEYSPYPEGSRDKYALIAPENPGDERVVQNHRYLLKFSNRRYPGQFWSEIIAHIIGNHVGVLVPPCFYAEDPISGDPGSLIEWFYGEAIERNLPVLPTLVQGVITDATDIPTNAPVDHSLYVAGSSYMVRMIEGYDLKTGKQHNLRSIGTLITRFRQLWGIDYWPHWASILTFDALIGNTDRHQDNWGVLWRAALDGSFAPRFSPAFDNGTALLHEIIEERLNRFDDPATLERYVDRGRHHIRWEVSDEKPVGHIDLIKRLAQQRPNLIPDIERVLKFDQERLREEIFGLVEVPSEVPLSERRAAAIFKAVILRKDKIQRILADI